MMRPYVGKHFHDAATPSLLLIGESHYFPEESLQHTTSETWYSGSSATLTQDEIEYISTAALLDDSRAEGFSNKSHSIWSNPFSIINEHGPRYSDYTRIADDIAFYNFFLRPALTGESLAVTEEDAKIANEAFLLIYAELKPSAVVFLSTLAYNNFRHSLPIPVIATPHPASAWWNRAAAKYDNKCGWEILAAFIDTLNWRKDTTPNETVA